MAAAVNDRSAAAEAMAADWPMTEALMKGTRAMRAAKDTMLPKFPSEEQPSYDARLAAATLFPAFRRTVSVMAGKPFAKALTQSEDAPPDIIAWSDDIDREGINLHAFAAEMLAEALAHGLCGILVEAPKPIATGPRPVTKADEKQAGVRPYFVRVMHGQILGWRVEIVDGARQLGQLRILESVTQPDGEFGEKTVERVRVLEPGTWRVFEKSETVGADGKHQWIEIESGVSGLPVIPFVPLYGRRIGFMQGASPLLDLAFLNVKHWQSQSDQDTILHVARVPILAMIGAETETTLTVGAASAVKLPQGADLKFVEHTGKAIEAGAKALADLEQQMIQAGAELLVKRPGDRSATESANDAEANKSDLQRIVEGFEDALDQAMQFMADYARLGSGGSVSLFKDFGAATLSEASGQLVLSMQTSGLISKETAIAELKRRGELAAEIDAADEADKVEAEGPALGTMTDDKTGTADDALAA
jgi:hypothetical protein